MSYLQTTSKRMAFTCLIFERPNHSSQVALVFNPQNGKTCQTLPYDTQIVFKSSSIYHDSLCGVCEEIPVWAELANRVLYLARLFSKQ